MRTALLASFCAAVACHLLLLFGIRLHTEAQPLPAAAGLAAVDVDLVAGEEIGGPAGAATDPSKPEPIHPEATPEPLPTPQPTPPPMAEATPKPEPQPIATPAPSEMAEAPEPPPPSPTPTPVSQIRIRPKAPSSHLVKAAAHRTTHAPAVAPVAAGAGTGAGPGGGSGGSVGARPLWSNPKPRYPEESRHLGQEGIVLLVVDVDPSGRVASVTIGRSSGFPLLDESSVHTVRHWRFQPAHADGVPVSSRVQLPVRFDLREH